MIVYTDEVTKPNSTVLWNKCMTKEIFNYLVSKYYTKIILLHIGRFNTETLTSTLATKQSTTMVFTSMSEYEAYNNDPYLANWRACVQTHNETNGILKSNITLTDFSQLSSEENERLTNLLGTFGLYNASGSPIPLTDFGGK